MTDITPGTAPTNPEFIDTGLNDGTEYFYAVAAFNATGDGEQSDEDSATTLPAAPTGLNASATVARQITLMWDATPGADSYTVYRRTIGALTILMANIPGTNFTDTGLDAGTEYFYAVTATNGTGEGAQSGEDSATTLPAAPTGLIATASATVAGQIALSWNATTGADSYMIYRGETTGALTDITPDPAPENPEFIDTGLDDGTEYFYAVTATNGTGEGARSEGANATTLPAAPTGLNVAASATVAGQITLMWDATTGADSYTVYRRTIGALTILMANIPGTNFTDTGLDDGTEYFYAVTATNGTGEGAQSGEDSATTLPAAPTGLIATASTTVAGQIALSWNATTGADSYTVYRGTESSDVNTVVGNNIGVVTYTNTGLANGEEYFYEVTAVNSAGESARSNRDSATTIIPAPTDLMADVTTTAGSVILSWTPVVGAESYRIYRSILIGAPAAITPPAPEPTTPTFTDNDPALGTIFPYTYTVAAIIGGVAGEQSTPVIANVQ